VSLHYLEGRHEWFPRFSQRIETLSAKKNK
jgi:hypothetical protein